MRRRYPWPQTPTPPRNILGYCECRHSDGSGAIGPAAADQPRPDQSVRLAKTDAGPDGIAVDPFGNVYTANSRANTVTRISPAGKATTVGTTGEKPRGIALDASGNIYTSNLQSNNVTKITPAGVSTILGSTGRQPIDLAVDGQGNVYDELLGQHRHQDLPGWGVNDPGRDRIAAAGNRSGP